ncbi:hypothetical protein R1sor_002931 [Riccia sorocarpa]|uniref:Uncharacterized protein n=1 Tax=Riccia sorocarpa TaxID=122646 RepID=A0ABD3H437_9MARC
MATLLMRASTADGTGGAVDKKRRSRKGKNAQKRQPQRGLGVAQLEKLRLQEQSLLCAPVSTTSSSYSVRLYTPAAADLITTRCEADVSQTILSLANGAAAASSLMRENGLTTSGHGEQSPNSSGMSCRTHLQSCHQLQGGKCDGGESRLLASRALASCLSSSSQPTSKFSSAANVPLLSTSLLTGHASSPLQDVGYDCEGRSHGLKVEDHELRVVLPGGACAEITTNTSHAAPSFYIYSAAIQNLKDAAAAAAAAAATPVVDSAAPASAAGYKLPSFFKNVSRIPIAISDPTQYIETLLGSDHILPHGTTISKRVELPMVGASPNADRPKELHSFQNLQTNSSIRAWPTSPDKASGRKRPWSSIIENGRHESPAAASQALDLNAPARDNEQLLNIHVDRHCAPVTQDLVPENHVGAHYTTGIVRSALGNSCLSLVKMRASNSSGALPLWQDSDSPSSASGYYSDMSLYTAPAAADNSVCFKQSASPSVARDGCSSVSSGPASYLTLSSRSPSRCLNNESETTPSPVRKESSICSSNFLTLGMSTTTFYSPVGNGWHESEESTQDTMMSMSKLKRSSSSGCDGDEGLQICTSITQELSAVELEKHKSLRNGLALQREHVFSPVSSSSLSANSPLRSAGTGHGAEDILDLRLKLAL